MWKIACLCVIVYFAVVVCISFQEVAHSATQTFNSGWPSVWTACSIFQSLFGSFGAWGYVPVRQSAAASPIILDTDGGDHSSTSFSLPLQSLWEYMFNSRVQQVMCKGGPLAIAATAFMQVLRSGI